MSHFLNRGQTLRRVVGAIAIAAVRYFLIKFSRGKIIAFDLDEALSFEGESGPYVQYAVVRANNIFQKLAQREQLDDAALIRSLADLPPAELDGANGSHELWGLVLDAARLDGCGSVARRFARHAPVPATGQAQHIRFRAGAGCAAAPATRRCACRR